MPIMLRDIWNIENTGDYKIHFARTNGHHEPLEVWARSTEEWQGWQEYRSGRNDFNRPLIFSLMQFYHELDSWLFGGVYRVLARHDDRYDVELAESGKNLIGRLKLGSTYRERTTRVRMESHYDSFEVREILRESYTGKPFPGYEEIDVSFQELETLVRNDRPDWKIALESVKGVYLVTDTQTGRRYVGSAYGEHGVWSRWRSYIFSGHGGNVELRKLTKGGDLTYYRKHFSFALLEHRLSSTPDNIILDREAYWKRILLTRGEHGLNRN